MSATKKNGDQFVSIFNDVLGPVMRGPSSSHTAGAYRIATLALSLYGAAPRKVVCTFDPDGSYAPTYLPLGVDKAFCAALIGMDMLDPGYDSAVEKANSQMDVRFTIKSLERNEHPNTARITFDDDFTVWARSTGGGVVELFNVAGHDISISGKYRDAVVFGIDDQNVIDSIVKRGESVDDLSVIGVSDGCVQVRTDSSDWQPVERFVSGIDCSVAKAEPVFFPRGGDVIARSGADFLRYASDHECSMGEAAIGYETRLLGISRKQVVQEMNRRYEVMRNSATQGYDPESVHLSWLKPHASTMMGRFSKLPYGGYHSNAAMIAHAVMHTCNSRGVVCAAPTGGSAGVLPGVMMTLEDAFGYSRDEVIRALCAAGAVGLIMAVRGTFAAETAGCQVEIGIAGAMAAAAAADIAGGSADMAMDAASISLQNTMGSICDPVGGGCEIPCHTRNGAAASSAFTCADLVFGGYKNPIPLDETVDVAYDVGKRLHADFRCTARGGIAVAPSALDLVQKAGQRENEERS